MTQGISALAAGLKGVLAIFRRRRLTVRGRIAIGFVAVMVVVVVLQLDAMRNLEVSTEDAQFRIPQQTQNYDAFSDTQVAVSDIHRTAQRLVLAVATLQPVPIDLQTSIKSQATVALDHLQMIQSTDNGTTESVSDARAAITRYTVIVGDAVELIAISSVNNAGSASFADTILGAGERVDIALQAVGTELEREVGLFVDEAAEHAADTRTGFYVLWIVGTGAGLGLAVYLGAVFTRVSKKISATVGTMAAVDLPRLVEVAGAVGRGDLTQRFTSQAQRVDDSSSDEFGVISQHINRMVDQISDVGEALDSSVQALQGLVGKAQSFSSRVLEGTTLLAEGSNESARAAAEVANAINGVAEGSAYQAHATDDMAESVQHITDIVQWAATGISEVHLLSNETAALAETGQSSIDDAAAAMDRITVSFTRVSQEVAELDDHSREVEEIVRLIRAIADQTNLLALNAAIEAARAGDLGKGFAVVAAEVKKLAEEAATSTEQINEIVDKMRRAVSAAVSAADEGSTTVESGSQTVLNAGESFGHIVRSVQQIHGQMQGLGTHASDVSTATDRITERSQRLVSVAESNSATGEEVAAASEEAAAASQEIGATAAELSNLADELALSLNHFVLPASST